MMGLAILDMDVFIYVTEAFWEYLFSKRGRRNESCKVMILKLPID